MADLKNKFRRGGSKSSIWTRLRAGNCAVTSPAGLKCTLYGEEEPLPDDDDPTEETLFSLINPWRVLAFLVFLSLISSLLYILILMWWPRSMDDIKGLADDGIEARDLAALIAQTKGAPISLGEAEINRYLAQSCRMRQDGAVSLVARPSSLVVKIHQGYAELIITRHIASYLPQTTSVFLRVKTEGSSYRLELSSDRRIWGRYAEGGKLGHLPIPSHFMQLILPSLENLMEIYPEMAKLLRSELYMPDFQRVSEEAEGRLLLRPLGNF